MAYIEIPGERVPTWRFTPDDLPSEFESPVSELMLTMARTEGDCLLFRGVPIDRYPAIVSCGVDVDPTDTAIFCADLSKALEYTKWPTGQRAGAVMVFRARRLLRSFEILPDDASVEDTEAVRGDYPHIHDDGHTRWRSRVPTSAAFSYEDAYGYWIPGDPFDALAAVLLVGTIAEPLDWSVPGQPSRIWIPSDSISPPTWVSRFGGPGIR